MAAWPGASPTGAPRRLPPPSDSEPLPACDNLTRARRPRRMPTCMEETRKPYASIDQESDEHSHYPPHTAVPHRERAGLALADRSRHGLGRLVLCLLYTSP